MKDGEIPKLNVLRSPPDVRDWEAATIYRTIKLPDVVDYREVMLPIRDQGTQGSCAAMAGAAMKEWQEHLELDIHDYMSPQFIYNNREDISQEGMHMRDLMEILKQKGDCLESAFPYGSSGKPSQETYVAAAIYRTLNYAFVDTIDLVKTSLYINGPCIIAVPVYNYSERMWYQNSGESFLGGHALCVVGYNLEGFIIRNSWGKNWGKEGYCIMPYSDFGLQWELWTTIDAKSFEPPVPPEPVPPEPERKGCLRKFW